MPNFMQSPMRSQFDKALRGPMEYSRRSGGAFNPTSMFSNGEQGWVYDLADFSTLFQDSAGTIPVTAVEQPVGLVLDKSKGLVLGPELVTNGDFSNGTTGWPTYGAAIASVDAQRLKYTGISGNNDIVYQAVPTTIGKWYEVRWTAENGTAIPRFYVGSALGNSALVPLVNSAGTFSARFFATHAAAYVQLATAYSLSEQTAFFDNLSVKLLPGNHAYQSTAGKRPLLKVDGNGKHYLKGDGIDDFLQTSSINFTGTDKLALWAGVRKLDDTARMIAELSSNMNNSAGSFYVLQGTDAGLPTGYISIARGAASVSATQMAYSGSFPAPDTAVLTSTHDISGDLSTLARNGVAGTPGTGEKGTGNFGNYPMYFMSRAGSGVFFNGHLHSSVCLGRAATADELAKTQAWVAEKTGVTI